MAGGFAPLGPPLLPWENHMERGQIPNGQTLQLLDRIDPVGRFVKKNIHNKLLELGVYNFDRMFATMKDKLFLQIA